MSRPKRTWFPRLSGWPVSWQGGTDEPRMVALCTDLDGRELRTLLTPQRARELAAALVAQAEWIQRANAKHGNGWASDDPNRPKS